MDPSLLDAVMGPIWAALGAVGHKALTEVEDESASGIVSLGRQLLARLRHSGRSGEPARPQLDSAVAGIASDPDNEDARSALREQVKRALSGLDGAKDAQLAADLTSLLDRAGIYVSAEGPGSVAVENNHGIISTGSNAKNTIHRDGS